MLLYLPKTTKKLIKNYFKCNFNVNPLSASDVHGRNDADIVCRGRSASYKKIH